MLSPKRPILAVSVADAATEHLRSLLFSGSIRPGQELKDTAIAKELGIARPTARTAVQRLVSEGLLVREPGHSAKMPTFSVDDVVDLFDVRRLIEFEAVSVVIGEQKSTAGIARALAKFDQAGEVWEAGPDADAEFHGAVVAAAGSARLARMFAGITAEMRLMTGLLRSRYGSLSELSEEHAKLLEALDEGDRERVVRLWGEHIDDAEVFLVEAVARR